MSFEYSKLNYKWCKSKYLYWKIYPFKKIELTNAFKNINLLLKKICVIRCYNIVIK